MLRKILKKVKKKIRLEVTYKRMKKLLHGLETMQFSFFYLSYKVLYISNVIVE